MAATGIRFDDGSGGFAANCFPVRGLMRQTEDGSGAWLVAARAEQRRRFKAVICAKPRDYETIRQERKRAEKEGTNIVPPTAYDEEDEEETKMLDGFFLMKHCCVEDPSDLCSINISGQGFSDVKEEDFALFDNVAYVNASENFLHLEAFTHFPIIRELELPLNGLMGIGLNLGDFLTLELLDLSYNNLMPDDLLPLGLLPKLRVLHLTGNGLNSLPPELSRPHVEQMKQGSRKIGRFPALEILLLDDNRLSDLTSFAALAGLRNLKHLNMSKNEIISVPQLMLVEGRHVTQVFDDPEVQRMKSRASSRKSGRKSRARSSRVASRADSKHPSSAGALSTKGESKKQTDENQVNETVPVPANTVITSETGGDNSGIGGKEASAQSMAVEVSDTTGTDLKTTAENTEEARQTPQNVIQIPTDTSMLENETDSGSQKKDTTSRTDLTDPQTNTKTETTESETKLESETETKGNSTEEPKADREASSESLYDLDGALEELDLDKLAPKVEEEKAQKIEEAVEQEMAAEEEAQRKADLVEQLSHQEYDSDDPLPPPFPELRYLDVSHNQIKDEEGLLAVAAWPMLSELLIHKNPLTTQTSGDPPMLKRFLHDRLGIHLQRKEPGPLSKPHIEVQQRPERTVKTKIYPVPRVDVDALLAIEPPKSRNSQPTVISEKTEPRTDSAQTSTPVGGAAMFDTSKPLPPIPPTPSDGRDSDEDSDAGYDADSMASSSAREDGFFMTTVGDQEYERTSPSKSKSSKSKSSKSTHRRMRREQQESRPISSRYQGYEELLDIDETQIQDAIPLPKDISGNIRALQYTLNHPLVFRENKVHLDKVQKPFKPYIKPNLESSRARKPRSQTVEEALATMRQRKTVEEEELTTVLKDKKKYRKHFGNANGLLSEVQRRYNMVRASSMRDNQYLKEVMQDTLQSIQDTTDSTSHLITSESS